MKQWVYISLMLLFTVFLFSCKDDELENVNVEDRMPELTLKFTEAEISRTSLNSSEPLQHVENVKLYIYQMDASTAAEGTTETAAEFEQRIQGATLCATEILPWKNQSTSSGVSMSYKIQTPLEPGGEYVFLAVGTDAESEENYEFPTIEIDNSPKFKNAQARFKGETLSEQELREKMAKSEFFSGYQVAQLCSPDPGSKSILAPLKKDDTGKYFYDKAGQTTVELTRAVAGVLLYMTDIPARWNKPGESGDGYRVTKVKLRLHRMPASSVSLCGQSAGTGGSTEAGTEEGPVLIESMDLSELQFPSGGDLYQIVGQKGEVQTLDNTLLYGAYLLPVSSSETGKATFTLELWGKACDEAGTIKDVAKEMKLDDFECILENTASSDFAIERNHVYCIGQKPVADDTEGDAPVSLAGKEIVVDVQNWIQISDVIKFPYVDTSLKFEPDFAIGYRFNCINSKFTIDIKCEKTNGWKMSIEEGKNWLKVKDGNSWGNVYEQSAATAGTSNDATLTFFMDDYVEWKDYTSDADITNDVRTVVLYLQMYGDDGTTLAGNVKTLTIEQYNAICVEFNGKDWSHRDQTYRVGFSRLDVGDSFLTRKPEGSNEQWVGKAEKTGTKCYPWGFMDIAAPSVSSEYTDYYYGRNVVEHLYSGPAEKWTLGIALSEAITVSPNHEGNDLVSTEIDKILSFNYGDDNAIAQKYASSPTNGKYENRNYWYLPASYELLSLMGLMRNKYPNFQSNLTDNGWYWTVNPAVRGALEFDMRAWGYQYVKNIDDDGTFSRLSRNNTNVFIRPCFKIK